MGTNGFQIKEAMRKCTVEKDIASKMFNESLFAFEGDVKSSPLEVAKRFMEADFMLAKLQELQQLYNLQVKVKVNNQEVTLALAVKLIGGAGRMEKMWRSASTDTGRDRWDNRQIERNKENEYAKRQVTMDAAMNEAKEAAQYAASVRTAIAQGNMTEVKLGEGVFTEFDPKLI